MVVLQEIWGVNAHIRAVADQYAADGFVVLAPDVFWRQEPSVDLKYDEKDTQKAYHLMQNLDAPNADLDLITTAQALRQRPELNGKIGVVGYCMGGRLAYRMAVNGAVDAAVCYYGGGIQNQLDVAASVKAPILFHYGALDKNIPASAVDAVKTAFASHQDAQIYTYENADHGFNCWGRPMYNQRAAALAHGRTLEWLSSRVC
jgi:carboxymethylenebutenolidase